MGTSIRQQAIKARDKGLKFFDAEEPCPRGHHTRYSNSRKCVECARDQNKLPVISTKNTVLKQAKAARDRGDETYVPIEPCHNGHILRYSKSGLCVECHRLNRLISMQRYYSRTPEQRAYDNAQHLQWQKDHPERQSEMVMRWQRANKDRMQIIAKRYAAKKKLALVPT